MNIPESVLKQGGKRIERYAKLALQKDRLHKELLEIQSKIESMFVAINKQIGRFLPDGGRSVESDSFYYESTTYRHLVPKLNGSDPINNIYATEELLKEIRELSLDGRAKQSEKDLLEKKMEELRYGK